jgi:hypothetical protein
MRPDAPARGDQLRMSEEASSSAAAPVGAHAHPLLQRGLFRKTPRAKQEPAAGDAAATPATPETQLAVGAPLAAPAEDVTIESVTHVGELMAPYAKPRAANGKPNATAARPGTAVKAAYVGNHMHARHWSVQLAQGALSRKGIGEMLEIMGEPLPAHAHIHVLAGPDLAHLFEEWYKDAINWRRTMYNEHGQVRMHFAEHVYESITKHAHLQHLSQTQRLAIAAAYAYAWAVWWMMVRDREMFEQHGLTASVLAQERRDSRDARTLVSDALCRLATRLDGGRPAAGCRAVGFAAAYTAGQSVESTLAVISQ